MDYLPSSLTHIHTPAFACFKKDIDYLPHSLLSLELGYCCGLPIFPSINCGSRYIISMGHNWLDRIAHRNISSYFNRPLDHLPSSLIHLTLSCCFNCPLDNLPPSLLSMLFREPSSFNQPLDHLPTSLTHLAIPPNFNHPLNYLPSSLLFFSLPNNYDLPLLHLPPSIVESNRRDEVK
jgi:hypothetical protein